MTVLQSTKDRVERRGFEMLFDDSRPMPDQDRGCPLFFGGASLAERFD